MLLLFDIANDLSGPCDANPSGSNEFEQPFELGKRALDNSRSHDHFNMGPITNLPNGTYI